MMKAQLLPIILFLITTALCAQQTSESGWQKVKIQPAKFLTVNWSKNMQTNATMEQMPIEVQIQSSDSVRVSMVKVYVDGMLVQGSKGDEVSLRGNPKELTYRQSLGLKEGLSKVEIEVSNTVGTKRTEARFFQKKGNTIKLVNKETINQQKVIWQSPIDPLELDGKPLTLKQPEVEIKLRFTSPQYIELKDIIVYQNNRIVSKTPRATLKLLDDSYVFKDYVLLDEKEDVNRLFVIVKTPEMEMQSDPLLLSYRSFRPNVHILSIGTSSNLVYTEKDALNFSQLYKNQGGKADNKLFNSINVDVLAGQEAVASEIRGRIEDLKTKYETGNIKDNDLIILFISSHGFVYNNEFRLQGSDYKASRSEETSVSFQRNVLDKLEQINAKKIIFIDACHSGGKGSIADINQEIAKLNSIQKGIAVVSSSQKTEESYEDKVWENGAFTSALLRGMQTGVADSDNNSIITLDELDKYLQSEVPAMVNKLKGKPQHPIIFNKGLGNIAVFVRQ